LCFCDFDIVDRKINLEAAMLAGPFECCGFKHDVTFVIGYVERI